MNKRAVGKFFEEQAAKFLAKRGYKILEQNFHSRFGEIDIIALDGDILVFVEVKNRSSLKFGKPEEAVSFKKLARIEKVGSFYKLLHPNLPEALRIDVVSIEDGQINLIKNAS